MQRRARGAWRGTEVTAARATRSAMLSQALPHQHTAVGLPSSTAAPRAAGGSSAGFLPALALAMVQPGRPGALQRLLASHLSMRAAARASA